jgi:hypothetical protein
MGRPRISEEAKARAIQLAGQGVPQETIALRLKREELVKSISQSSISKILSAAKKAGVPINHRTRADPRTIQRRADERELAPAAKIVATAAAIDPEVVGTIEHLKARLLEIGQLIQTAAAGELANPTQFRDLVKLEADMVQRVNALTPPAAPDPDEDPSNIEARRILIGRIERLVDHEEKKAK